MNLASRLGNFISALAVDIKTINNKAIKANKNILQNREYCHWIPRYENSPEVLGMNVFSSNANTQTSTCLIENNISEIKRFKYMSDINYGFSVWNNVKNCRIGRTIYSTGFKTIYRFAFDDGVSFNNNTSFFIGLSDDNSDIRTWDLDTKTNKIGFGFKPNDTYFKFYCAGTTLSSILLTSIGAISSRNIYEFAIAHNGRENLIRIKISNLTTDLHEFINFDLSTADKAPDENILLTPFSLFRKSNNNSANSIDLMFFSLEKLTAQNNIIFPSTENQNDLNLTENISSNNDLNLI